jgi:hydroxymethylbilane synthase
MGQNQGKTAYLRNGMRHIRIASRASKLALVQSNYTRDLLLNLSLGADISIVKISTKGDRDKSDFLYKSESIGFFTSEVENAILSNQADIAVHSLKDLPTTIAPGLIVAAIPKRESPADALVTSSQTASIADLPAGATVGTSSLRRIAQLKHQRDDLNCVPLRGNVETRVNKVLSGQVDAAIVACAGMNRIGMSDKISAVLPPNVFIPAPAQGALAIQIRTDDSELAELLSRINDDPTRIAVEAERTVLAAMHGGCSIPLGVYSHIEGDTITIDAMLSDFEGKRYIKQSQSAHISDANACAAKLAGEMLSAGGQEILDKIRTEKQE